MQSNDVWTPTQWHCLGCGSLVTGFTNARGDIKVECKVCKMVMVRTVKGQRHSTVETYTPKAPRKRKSNSTTGVPTDRVASRVNPAPGHTSELS